MILINANYSKHIKAICIYFINTDLGTFHCIIINIHYYYTSNNGEGNNTPAHYIGMYGQGIFYSLLIILI